MKYEYNPLERSTRHKVEGIRVNLSFRSTEMELMLRLLQANLETDLEKKLQGIYKSHLQIFGIKFESGKPSFSRVLIERIRVNITLSYKEVEIITRMLRIDRSNFLSGELLDKMEKVLESHFQIFGLGTTRGIVASQPSEFSLFD